MRQKDIRPAPARIEFKGMKFLITDRPSDATIPGYISELKKHNVSIVVRVCEPSYKTDELAKNDIIVRDLAFEDGTFPPNEIVMEWFEILKQKFQEDPEACVAVHCVAGLGRAPVLVALALIELGLKYEAAVELIRERNHVSGHGHTGDGSWQRMIEQDRQNMHNKLVVTARENDTKTNQQKLVIGWRKVPTGPL
ncbi:AGAP008708-PA-like protein [Anopheles sinensis]|uniref:protein-tyrosine-phosphatase n=1 Tax=Anopheles sinensis TaxID=74873 RepID=A0A084VMH1_ANOSI|nr:AGAP008708-PA-like protein [Anopheles sinensis]